MRLSSTSKHIQRWPRQLMSISLMLALLTVIVGCGAGKTGEERTVNTASSTGVEHTPTLACTITNADLAPHTLPAALPEGLTWLTNDSDPEFADPNAKRGGTYRTFMLSFPATFRLVGPDSNGGFASIVRANAMQTTRRHPNSFKHIPVLATHWAFGADGRTVFYRLNPKARWSDGKPVTANDYLFNLKQMRSKAIVDPWYNDQFTNVIVDVMKYDDHTVGVMGVAARPADEMLEEYELRPTACHAHKLDAKWVRDYNWLVEPTVGPYVISRMERGKFVELQRVANWWGDDQRYLRHRFNPDTVRITVIREPDTALQFFLKGELDAFPLTLPQYWYDKAKGPAIDNGWISRMTYFTDHPESGNGFFLNADDPLLKDRNVRVGLAYSMNFDKVIKTVLRNDYVRSKSHFEGFFDYSDPTLHALPFDLVAADRAFTAAGFTTRGADGIRRRGTERLSVQVVYGNPTHTDRLSVLVQEARLAGVELVLQRLDGAAAFKMAREKKHQASWMAWAGASTVPPFWEYYHSVNAHKAQTNNVSNYADPETDRLIDAFRSSADKVERVRLAQQIERRTQDAAVLIPGLRVPFVREGYWRYLKLPAWNATRTTGYGLSGGIFDPFYDGLFWIDEPAQREVTQARAANTALPRVNVTDTTWRRSG